MKFFELDTSAMI